MTHGQGLIGPVFQEVMGSPVHQEPGCVSPLLTRAWL